MKILCIVVLSAGILGGVLIGALITTDIGSTVHGWSHKAGLCAGHGCLIPEIDPTALDRYSEDERTVIRLMADQIIGHGNIDFSD